MKFNLRLEASQYLHRKICLPLTTSCMLLLAAACVSTQEGEKLQQDVFKVQKRLLELEQRQEKSGLENRNQGEAASQRIASSSVRLDQLEADLRSLRGEIDTLRVGVVTGELPGQDEQSDSLAKAIRKLDERLSQLEATQIEMLTLLKNKKKSEASAPRSTLKTLEDLRQAFHNKHYLQIVEHSEMISKQLKNAADKEESHYLHAESLFKLGKLREAALSFHELHEAKYLKEKKAVVTLRLADCFRQLGDKKAALAFYQEVVQKFPRSEAATSAKAQLAKPGL